MHHKTTPPYLGLCQRYLLGLIIGLTAPLPLQAQETVEERPRPSRSSTTAQPARAADEPVEADPSTATELSPVHVEGLLESGTGPVHGYAAKRSVTALKTDTPLIKTPQNVDVITADQMQSQNANSVSAALRYTGGVLSAGRGASGSLYDIIKVRGFSPEQFQDGLRVGTYSYSRPKTDPYLQERIEVLKGPASVLYGQTPPGGAINYVSKRPSPDQENEFFLKGGNDARFRGGFDIGGALDENGDVLYRLVGVGERRDGPPHHTTTANFSFAPSLSVDFSDDTRLTLLAKVRHDPDSLPYIFLPYEGSVTRMPNGEHLKRSFYDGDKDYHRFKRTNYQLGYEFEHDFNQHITFQQNLRYAYDDVDYRGAYGYGWIQPGAVLNRYIADDQVKRHTFTVDNRLLFDFDTGPVEHTLLAGIDYSRLTARDDDGTGLYAQAPALDIWNPKRHAGIPRLADRPHHNFHQYQLGYYLQDQLSLGNLVLIGGGRYDRARTSMQTRQTSTTKESRTDHAATVRAGALYAFDFGLSPYFSYSESFQAPDTENVRSDVTKPTRGHQYELGVKYQPPGHDIMLTASGFWSQQKNIPSATPGPIGQAEKGAGKADVNGIDLSAVASLTDGLDLTAAATWLHSRIRSSDDPGVKAGNKLGRTPRYTTSLWLDYTQPEGRWQGLGGGAGVRYVSSMQINDQNEAKTPSYTVFDMTAHYELGGLSRQLDGLRVGLNMQNIFNKRYVASCRGIDACYYGYGRETTATVSYHWD